MGPGLAAPNYWVRGGVLLFAARKLQTSPRIVILTSMLSCRITAYVHLATHTVHCGRWHLHSINEVADRTVRQVLWLACGFAGSEVWQGQGMSGCSALSCRRMRVQKGLNAGSLECETRMRCGRFES